jgi:putative NADH-flavin reductase
MLGSYAPSGRIGMKITVFGATGAIGRLITDRALAESHQVTAYVRRSGAFPPDRQGLTVVVGPLTDQALIEQAVDKADAVISTLGPALDLSRRDKGTPIADGYRTIVRAMESRGARRLVLLATPSIPADHDPKRFWAIRLVAKTAMPNAFRDIVAVGEIVRGSSLDWTIARIINPNVEHRRDDHGVWLGEGPFRMGVSRANVAAFMVKVAEEGLYLKKLPLVFNA